MRASRLVSILLLLQARGRLTAEQLAGELEVSVRTVYRDVDSLHAAGVPICAEAGHRGGYRLLDGYRTRLTGLSADEARALVLSGLPGPAAEIGLGSVLAAAQLKVQVALPPELGEQMARVQQRFFLDPLGWYASHGEAPFLPAVADAVWQGRALRVRYRRWKAPTDVDRRLEPYGLVLKAGRWYLVAGPGPRTYRIDQILSLTVLAEKVSVPEEFGLAGYWQAYQASFHEWLLRSDAEIRVAPGAERRLSGATARVLAEVGVTDADGWTRATVPVESAEHACREFLALGTDIEVLGPPQLRSRLAEIAQSIAAWHSGPPGGALGEHTADHAS